MEIIHSAVGLVRSPVFTTVAQVRSPSIDGPILYFIFLYFIEMS